MSISKKTWVDVAERVRAVIRIHGDDPKVAAALRDVIEELCCAFGEDNSAFKWQDFRELAGASLLDDYAKNWPQQALNAAAGEYRKDAWWRD